jgi:hypothetical protein
MFFEVHQNVHQRVAHGARCRERPRMVAIAPNPSPAPERAIHRTREANREAADSARERVFICGLRDEMDMVVLDAELDDAERAVRRRCQRAALRAPDAPPRARGARGVERSSVGRGPVCVPRQLDGRPM